MSIRLGISILVFLLIAPIVFGTGLVSVLMLTDQSSVRAYAIAAVVTATVLIAAPLSWLVAPRLRSHFLRQHPHAPLD
ncbi:MAG: hypothetical protein H7Z12_08905 [Rhodospirillaceae bacterium]|nr:hypothetical protein [Rhodospirillales bacterium]